MHVYRKLMKKENKTCKQMEIDCLRGHFNIAQAIGSTDKFSTAILVYLFRPLCVDKSST